MRRKRFEVPIKRNQSFTLNITSMTDMFTILLVFLLQSFAAGEVSIDPIQGLNLPDSSTEKNPIFGVKLALSPTELVFDQTTIAKVVNSNFETTVIDSNDSNFIKPLFEELQKINKSDKESDKQLAKHGRILFQADRDLPYSTIRKVMYTASMAGFPNLKLVTTVSK
jgi:biopolymer transport protein ExbD